LSRPALLPQKHPHRRNRLVARSEVYAAVHLVAAFVCFAASLHFFAVAHRTKLAGIDAEVRKELHRRAGTPVSQAHVVLRRATQSAVADQDQRSAGEIAEDRLQRIGILSQTARSVRTNTEFVVIEIGIHQLIHALLQRSSRSGGALWRWRWGNVHVHGYGACDAATRVARGEHISCRVVREHLTCARWHDGANSVIDAYFVCAFYHPTQGRGLASIHRGRLSH